MRQDSEIKSEVISELEDVVFGESDEGLLDRLMVEEVNVDAGVVSVALVFDGDSTPSEQEALVAEVKAVCSDLEGVVTVAVKTLGIADLGPDSGRPNRTEVEKVPPVTEASNGRSGPGLLTLSALLGGITETEPASTNLYTGGGCEVGTAEGVPRIDEAMSSAPVSESELGGQVLIPLREYRELVNAQRELELRPTFEQYRAALEKVARYEAMVSALEAVLGAATSR